MHWFWPSLIALAVVGIPPIMLGLFVYEKLRRDPHGETRCRKCGYILRGLTEPRCSECGERI